MKTITSQELHERLEKGENIHLLDVREDAERAEFNIGGQHIPLGQVQSMQFDAIEDWKNDEVVVYCRSGKRSMMACMMLEQYGFSNVVNLDGGMLGWQQTIR